MKIQIKCFKNHVPFPQLYTLRKVNNKLLKTVHPEKADLNIMNANAIIFENSNLLKKNNRNEAQCQEPRI